jgi:hypothetical protein
MTGHTLEVNPPLQRMPKKPLPHYTQFLLPALAAGSGALLGFAMPGLIGAETILDYVKCAVIAVSATGTAYGINRLAIEKGALQAAIGTSGAGLVSVASILSVGTGLFAATYAGFTIERTDRLRLEEYGYAQAAYVDGQVRRAREAARIEPAVHALLADLSDKEACERASSCLSGHGPGGEGPVFRALAAPSVRGPKRSLANSLPDAQAS